jgi:hypothetical protein
MISANNKPLHLAFHLQVRNTRPSAGLEVQSLLSLRVADSKCTGYTCPGDTSQLCGSPGGYISIYSDSKRYNPSNGSYIKGYAPPSAHLDVGAYGYVGCFSDSVGSRTLSVGSIGVAHGNSLPTATRLRIALRLARDTFTLERNMRRNATAETHFGTLQPKNLTHNAIKFGLETRQSSAALAVA